MTPPIFRKKCPKIQAFTLYQGMLAPKALNETGKKLWKKLYRSDLEASILTSYCLAYQNFLTCQSIIDNTPVADIPQRVITLWKNAASVMNQLGNKLKLDKPPEDLTSTSPIADMLGDNGS